MKGEVIFSGTKGLMGARRSEERKIRGTGWGRICSRYDIYL